MTWVQREYHSYYDEYYKIVADSIHLLPLHFSRKKNVDLIFSSELKYKTTNKLLFNTGITISKKSFELYGKSVDYNTNIYDAFLDGSGDTYYSHAFIQSKYKFSSRVNIVAGVNASYLGINNELLFEPRVSAQVFITPNHELALGLGRHSQTEMLPIYYIEKQNNKSFNYEFPNLNLKRLKSTHYVFSYNWLINANLRFKTEIYYQQLFDLPVVPGTHISLINFKNNWTFNHALTNEGKGFNTGIDITFERFLNKGFYSIITASIFKSLYTGGDGIERSTRYDGLFVFNLLAGKEIIVKTKNVIGFNFKSTFKGPELYQPINEALSHQYGEIIDDYTKPLERRKATVENATDINISYRINEQNKAHIISLQAKNIIGREYRGKRYNLKTNTIEEEYFSSIVPFISYRIEF